MKLLYFADLVLPLEAPLLLLLVFLELLGSALVLGVRIRSCNNVWCGR